MPAFHSSEQLFSFLNGDFLVLHHFQYHQAFFIGNRITLRCWRYKSKTFHPGYIHFNPGVMLIFH